MEIETFSASHLKMIVFRRHANLKRWFCRRNNDKFAEELQRLESSPACNKLPLLSFLMLPMQRVTRLPLLVSAVVHAADSANDSKIFKKAKHTLGVVNQVLLVAEFILLLVELSWKGKYFLTWFRC